LAIQKWLSTIETNFKANLDFAFELNLGMPRHYDDALSLKRQFPGHRLKVVLFFTGNLEICKKRADERFKAGGHEVNPIVLENMYHNMIPLFKHHFSTIDEAVFVNTNIYNITKPVGHYHSEQDMLSSFDLGTEWFTNDIGPFIEGHLQQDQLRRQISR
jgi:predicted ABC-type ATPase